MTIQTRRELPNDYKCVENVIQKAFENDPYGDQNEHLLVNRLRKSEAFIPQLSIVAEIEGEIVGHIFITKIIISDGIKNSESLAMAPVSVLPAYQRRGIGGRLITDAHKVALSLGYKSIILIGHEDYYPRFGYQKLARFNIQLPFDVPENNCMAIELVKGGLSGTQGRVQYPEAFYY